MEKKEKTEKKKKNNNNIILLVVVVVLLSQVTQLALLLVQATRRIKAKRSLLPNNDSIVEYRIVEYARDWWQYLPDSLQTGPHVWSPELHRYVIINGCLMVEQWLSHDVNGTMFGLRFNAISKEEVMQYSLWRDEMKILHQRMRSGEQPDRFYAIDKTDIIDHC